MRVKSDGDNRRATFGQGLVQITQALDRVDGGFTSVGGVTRGVAAAGGGGAA
jgi:hypothetical protein